MQTPNFQNNQAYNQPARYPAPGQPPQVYPAMQNHPWQQGGLVNNASQQGGQPNYPAPAGKIKYPKSLATAGRQGMMFSMDSNLRAMDEQEPFRSEKGIPPLTTFKPWASLALEFADSKKSAGGTGNIEVDHIADVRTRTIVAMHAIMEAETRKDGAEAGSAAMRLETKVFLLPPEAKAFKGASAWEIATKAGSQTALQCAALLEQNNGNPRFREKNMQQAADLRLCALLVDASAVKCPNGKTAAQMCLTPEAGHYYEELKRGNHPAAGIMGALITEINRDASVAVLLKSNLSDAGKHKTYRIYGPVFKTPDVNKLDPNGLTKAYQLSVVCDPAKEYPFRAELSTMKGKPLPNSQVGVIASTIVDRQTFSIDMPTWEWINMIERANWEKQMVELMFHGSAYRIMIEEDNRNYQNRKNRRD